MKVTYRVMGTADSFKDRNKVFSSAEHAIYVNNIRSEGEAKKLEAEFEQKHPPQGRNAYVVIEKCFNDGSYVTVLRRTRVGDEWG